MGESVVLFLAANPQSINTLRLDEEIRAISEKIRLSNKYNILHLVSAWAVRPDDLLQKLNEHRPNIVHFSGHGSQIGEIILVDDNGLPKHVGAAALEALFQVLKDNIQVVILNACYSQVQAEAITKIIDCVVGMESTIGDKAAITFASSFYRAIGFGRSVKEAFEQGKVALLLEGIEEEHIPRLVCKQGVDASKIIICSTETSSGNTPSSVSASSPNIAQTMNNSPGAIQVGGNLSVNAERQVTQTAINLLMKRLKNKPCPVTVGVLGLGGEPLQLANDLLQILQNAGCQVSGVNHGIGFPTFFGVRILYSPISPPVESIQVIADALQASKIDFVNVPDSNQAPGTIYLYVGYKPSHLRE